MPLPPRPGRLLSVALLFGALVGGLVCGPSTAVRAASFQVSPTRFEFSLAHRFTNFFTVTNNSGTLLRLRVSTGFLEPDAKGELRPVTGSPYDMASWLVINPRRMDLAPAEKRVVRFTVRPPTGLPQGEYRTVVFFEELPPRPTGHQEAGTGFEVQLLTRLGITIYGILGNPVADTHVQTPAVHVTANSVNVQALARNTGTARTTLTVKATLLDAAGSERGQTEERMVVQRDQARLLAFQFARPPAGTYHVHLSVSDTAHTLLETDLPVTVGADAQ